MQFESINNVQSQLDNLLDLVTKGFITANEYKTKSESLKNDLAKRQEEQADTASRAKNWYEFVGKTLDTLTNANEKFLVGDLADKKEILLAIGKNPVLINGSLDITPNEWLIPIKKDVKRIRRQLDEVRTMSTRSKDTVDKHMRNTWLGMSPTLRTP